MIHIILYTSFIYHSFGALYISSVLGFFIVSVLYAMTFEKRDIELFINKKKNIKKEETIGNDDELFNPKYYLPEFAIDNYKKNQNTIEKFKNCSIIKIKFIGENEFISNNNCEKCAKFFYLFFNKIDEELKNNYKKLHKIDTFGESFIAIGFNNDLDTVKFGLCALLEFKNICNLANVKDIDISISIAKGDIIGTIIGEQVPLYYIGGNALNQVKLIQAKNIANKIMCTQEIKNACNNAFKFEHESDSYFYIN